MTQRAETAQLSEPEKTKPYTVRLPARLIHAIKVCVAEQETSAQAVATELFADYLRKHNRLPESLDDLARAS